VKEEHGVKRTRIECDGTIRGNGKMYRGCKNVTRSGKVCQRWDSQQPHLHGENLPNKETEAGLESNYCRNPDNEHTIWCYTTDPQTRHEECYPVGGSPTKTPGFPVDPCGVSGDSPTALEPTLLATVQQFASHGHLEPAQNLTAMSALQSVWLKRLRNKKLRARLIMRSSTRYLKNKKNKAFSALSKIVCPQTVSRDSGVDLNSYEQRTASGACRTNRGLWAGNVMCAEMSKLLAVGVLMGYQAGEHVFDWGAGCGHMISWLEQSFSMQTSGHEYTASAATYAKEHTNAGSLCSGDGSTLPHVPDNSLDHIVSNAAVYHLSAAQQCGLVRDEFMRILRPGGTVWLGWMPTAEVVSDLHGSTDIGAAGWAKCLDKAGDRLLYEVINEQAFFTISEYDRQESNSVLVVKMEK